VEQTAGQQFGVPASLLASVRTKGERSNANQVSSAGARTVYQITPQTRQGIIQNYGFDPWASPENAARGAAAILREGYNRTGNWGGAVQQYIGGTDPTKYGPATAAYTSRVMGGY
jgi:soluble lytic murein transglycosylase-like protein